MYRSYFGLNESPFSVAPDPRYLYMSERHQEALAHLLYGVNGDGAFVLLTGEVGAGKTTLCRCLLEQVPATCDIAYIFNPKLTVVDLLSAICNEFGVAYPPGVTTIKTFVDRINTYLLAAHAKGRHTVLIIDEAQNLAVDVLEQMRLLTNLETNRRKLLQIILLGQPELAEMLERPELRQLAQRIVARYHLEPLTQSEVAAYVRHRLEVAGAQRQLFPPALAGRLYRLTHGIPRLINVLCDRALLGAYVQGKERIDRATLTQAAREVFSRPVPRHRRLLSFFSGGAIPRLAAPPAVTAHKPAPRNRGGAVQPAVGKPVSDANLAALAAGTDIAESSSPLPEFLEWPADEPRSRSKAMAYAALYRAWGTEYSNAEAKTQATQPGLRCLTARGGFDELRQLNRPAVLCLRNRRNREFYVTLIALDGNAATFVVGAIERSIAFRAVAPQWSGNYAMLWRLPPFAREELWPGERGQAVEWLSTQLAIVQGTDTEATREPVFDDSLVRRVKQFQLAQGLIPDGAAGAQTLMRLSCVTDLTAPVLCREPREK